jgi:hypothetical protein
MLYSLFLVLLYNKHTDDQPTREIFQKVYTQLYYE